MLALIDKWPGFPSSQNVLAEGDDGKVLAYAIVYGTNWSLNLLNAQREKHRSTVHFAEEDESAEYPTHTVPIDFIREYDDRTDDEREDEILARLLDKHGISDVEERAELVS
jgi:hypothetical protein